MEYNKSKWELKYEEFKSGSTDKEIEAIREKIKKGAQKFNEAIQNGKNNEAQKVQDDINKLQGDFKAKESKKNAITANLSKIENVIQLKKDLVKDSVELINKQNEIRRYEEAKKTIKNNDKAVAKLETEIKNIDAQIKQLNAKINDPTVDPEDRKLFQQDKEKLNGERKKKTTEIGKYNSEEYVKALKDKNELEGKVGKYDAKSISEALAKNEKLIAQSDLIGKCLLNGKNMSDITASLKNFTFTPNKDFAKKVSAMRGLYEKEEKSVTDTIKDKAEKANEEATQAFEKAQKAIDEVKKLEEEYKRISNLPVPETPWYKKIPGLKQIVNFFENKFSKGKTDINNIEDVKAKLDKAMREADEAKKEFYEKKIEAGKAEGEQIKAEKNRTVDYLSELRQQKDMATALEGMTLYGDTFKDRLKFQMPNIKTSLTQDEIDKAKSKNNYVLKNQKGKNDHSKDKRAYDVEARKAMIKKNIEKMTGKTVEELKAEKQARQDGDERD